MLGAAFYDVDAYLPLAVLGPCDVPLVAMNKVSCFIVDVSRPSPGLALYAVISSYCGFG